MRRTLHKVEFIDGKVVFANDPRHSKYEEVMAELRAEQSAEAAAVRVRRALADAKEGGYLTNAWYSYMDRRDIERMAEYLK